MPETGPATRLGCGEGETLGRRGRGVGVSAGSGGIIVALLSVCVRPGFDGCRLLSGPTSRVDGGGVPKRVSSLFEVDGVWVAADGPRRRLVSGAVLWPALQDPVAFSALCTSPLHRVEFSLLLRSTSLGP